MTELGCFHRATSQDSQESIVLPILGILVLDSKVLYNFLQVQEHQATHIIATFFQPQMSLNKKALPHPHSERIVCQT